MRSKRAVSIWHSSYSWQIIFERPYQVSERERERERHYRSHVAWGVNFPSSVFYDTLLTVLAVYCHVLQASLNNLVHVENELFISRVSFSLWRRTQSIIHDSTLMSTRLVSVVLRQLTFFNIRTYVLHRLVLLTSTEWNGPIRSEKCSMTIVKWVDSQFKEQDFISHYVDDDKHNIDISYQNQTSSTVSQDYDSLQNDNDSVWETCRSTHHDDHSD